MTNSLADNNSNVPVTPLSVFVDSVFSELSSHTNEWNVYLEGYGYFDSPDCWNNTLIPLAIRLYELAQTDDMVYFWLLQLMSQIDICKDRKEDFRKKDVFDVLSQLNLKHRTIILEKTVQNHAEELQKALDENVLDAFRSMLPIIDDDETIYNIGRVLKRAIDVRDIYERTVTYTKGDALGILFVLFRQFYYYFADAYEENHRASDGMAKNVFLALYQTQYRVDKNDFCDIADYIGNLWISGLILAYHYHNTQMPLAVRDILLDVLQGQNTIDKHGELYDELDNCDTEKQKEKLIEKYGGWLKLESYGFICRVLNEEHKMIIPPFSCKRTDVRHVRRVRVSGNTEHRKLHYQDNCYPYLESKNAVSLEELLKLRKDVPRLFELEKKASCFNGCVDEGSQVVIEETINEKARRLIGDLLPKLYDHLNSGQTPKKLNMFFDDILINKRKPINEQLAQENIVKRLFNNRSKYEYHGLKVIVFCRIIGYLLSKKVSVLTGDPKPIAEKLQPFLTRTNVQNGKDSNSVENLRSYIDKAKTGEIDPPGKSFIDIVLGLKGG